MMPFEPTAEELSEMIKADIQWEYEQMRKEDIHGRTLPDRNRTRIFRHALPSITPTHITQEVHEHE